MMLTDKGALGLRIMMRLGLQEGRGFLPMATLADELEISIFAMKQPIAALRAAGLIRGERGWNGGYILGRPATRITMTEIVDAIERPLRAGDTNGASLYEIWDEIGSRLYEFLSTISLASLIAGDPDLSGDGFAERRLVNAAT